MRLSEQVINQIAAGEVVHRPASAVKELVENSIDAGASTITVKAQAGGAKLLSIQDNGSGIKRQDMDIVCERFTTSKLRSFDDLKSIGTYGFRGEALASVTHVSHVTILTKTAEQQCAFKACYSNGKLCASKPGETVDPKPCAGVVGTLITMEDLFYNMPARKRAIQKGGDEYTKVLDVMSSYAVHKSLWPEDVEHNKMNPEKRIGVGMVCKKANSSTPDLHTNSSDSKIDTIRSIFGALVSNEVIYINEFQVIEPMELDEACQWSCRGYVTNANYNRKKSTFIIFINERLVNCNSIKRCLDLLYAEYLPKGTHPFVYLSLTMPPHHVDVNVHPTKREVHFLNEDIIAAHITDFIRSKLAGANTSRTFFTLQTLDTSQPFERETIPKRVPEQQLFQTPKKKKYTPSKLVRTDPTSRGLESFFRESSPDEEILTPEICDEARELSSIKNLVDQFRTNSDEQMIKMLKSMVFVGWVDECFCLVQVETGLYMMDYLAVSKELLYQECILHFGAFKRIVLETPCVLVEVLELGLRHRHAQKNSQDEILFNIKAKEMAAFLAQRTEMLEEYFRIGIVSGNLVSLPELISGHSPSLGALPAFLILLCEQVEWTNEQDCFESASYIMADYYVQSLPATNDDGTWNHNEQHPRNHLFKNVIFPLIRKKLYPPRDFLRGSEGVFVQVTRLENLYKIFERC